MPKSESTGSYRFAWFFLTALIVVADQLTKAWIVTDFSYGQGRVITDFFNLVHVHNYGAAFSFLSDAGGWQRWFFTILSSVVSVVIVVWITRLPRQRWLESLALALILGGALGNLYDRVFLGYVVDFLDFHWSGRHFPAFNVADSGITVGAFLLILDTFISDQDSKN
ncbi:MAG: signal peptidase II [Porticoccaceae bacterium]|jgi:signal peptidase II